MNKNVCWEKDVRGTTKFAETQLPNAKALVQNTTDLFFISKVFVQLTACWFVSVACAAARTTSSKDRIFNILLLQLSSSVREMVFSCALQLSSCSSNHTSAFHILCFPN